MAADNYAALKSFFHLYPDYKRNDFYVTGESYGGFYVPTLSVLVMNDASFNFKVNIVCLFVYSFNRFFRECWIL